jgi:hypothetical protein
MAMLGENEGRAGQAPPLGFGNYARWYRLFTAGTIIAAAAAAALGLGTSSAIAQPVCKNHFHVGQVGPIAGQTRALARFRAIRRWSVAVRVHDGPIYARWPKSIQRNSFCSPGYAGGWFCRVRAIPCR